MISKSEEIQRLLSLSPHFIWKILPCSDPTKLKNNTRRENRQFTDLFLLCDFSAWLRRLAHGLNITTVLMY